MKRTLPDGNILAVSCCWRPPPPQPSALIRHLVWFSRPEGVLVIWLLSTLKLMKHTASASASGYSRFYFSASLHAHALQALNAEAILIVPSQLLRTFWLDCWTDLGKQHTNVHICCQKSASFDFEGENPPPRKKTNFQTLLCIDPLRSCYLSSLDLWTCSFFSLLSPNSKH